jgi:hypothetical protein
VLLRIIEDYSEEFKVLSAGALTHLLRDKEVISIFKSFGGPEKLLR